MIEEQRDEKDPVVIAVTTFEDVNIARQFGTQLVESQLVACVNLLLGNESIYKWQGEIKAHSEDILWMKTTTSKLEALEAYIQENHPYEEPEFIVIPVTAGSAAYLNWVRATTA